MKIRTSFLSLALLFLSACAAEPETVIQTVVHEATVEIPQTVEVTRQVEVTQEVTRLVEVEVEVTNEIPVEVTRLVEVVVTATPEPTATPTPEPPATNTPEPVVVDTTPAPPSGTAGSLLQASNTLLTAIVAFRDGLGGGNCHEVVRTQDIFLTSPSFDVAGTPDEVQWSYGHYQSALALALDGALGIGDGCRNALETGQPFSITHLNYRDIMGKLDRAEQELRPAINILESLIG